MPAIQGSPGRSVVACGGGGGTVTGSITAGTVQNVSLVTLPASPTDAEYEVNVHGVVLQTTAAMMAVGMGPQFAPQQTNQNDATRGIDKKLYAGPGAAIAVPLVNLSYGGNYQISYSYVARRVA